MALARGLLIFVRGGVIISKRGFVITDFIRLGETEQHRILYPRIAKFYGDTVANSLQVRSKLRLYAMEHKLVARSRPSDEIILCDSTLQELFSGCRIVIRKVKGIVVGLLPAESRNHSREDVEKCVKNDHKMKEGKRE